MAQAERYGYTVARLRAMGHRLLDPGVFQRMLDAEDLQGALKILNETCYAPWLVEMKGEGAFDEAIEAELPQIAAARSANGTADWAAHFRREIAP